MQKEKITAIILVLIIVGALFVYIATKEDLFGSTTDEKLTIEAGDCVDVNYIIKYASNDTIFSSSYEDPLTKTGGVPLKVYVTDNSSAIPLDDYSDYYCSIITFMLIEDYSYIDYLLTPLAIKQGFIQNLIGMKKGQTKITEYLTAEEGFGVTPKVGDIIDLSSFLIEGLPELSIYDISTSEDDIMYYTIRDESHYIGEIIEYINDTTKYVSWLNSTSVTKINETLIWLETTPNTELNENFTWILEEITFDYLGQMLIRTTYPENTSFISSINNSTIIIIHSPNIGDEIVIDYSGWYDTVYTVVNLTDNFINVSYQIDAQGNLSYEEFDRKTVIERNVTQEIISSLPAYIVEEQLFVMLRQLDDKFSLSINILTDETIYLELDVVEVYKTSQQES